MCIMGTYNLKYVPLDSSFAAFEKGFDMNAYDIRIFLPAFNRKH